MPMLAMNGISFALQNVAAGRHGAVLTGCMCSQVYHNTSWLHRVQNTSTPHIWAILTWVANYMLASQGKNGAAPLSVQAQHTGVHLHRLQRIAPRLLGKVDDATRVIDLRAARLMGVS